MTVLEAPTPAAANDSKAGDKRRDRRRRVLFGGKIVFDQAARSIDCTIRDVSETGAQVRLAGFELLPETVHLIELRRGLAHEAKVAWVRPPHVGLLFLKSHPLAEAAPGSQLELMRRLWLEHVPRPAP
jgi:hypothetical protein